MTKQLVGIDLTQEDNVPVCDLLSKYELPNGDVYRYVRAAAAKTIGLVWGIDETGTVSATAAVTTESHPLLGVPARTSGAPATGYTYKHFWIQTAGNFASVEAGAAVADNAGCYATATAGKIDDGDGSGKLIRGWKFTALTSGAAATTVFAPCEQSLDQA